MPATAHLPGVFACDSVLVQTAGYQCRVFSSALQQRMGREEESMGGDPEVVFFHYDPLKVVSLLDRVQRQNRGTDRILETHGNWRAQLPTR